MLKDMLSDPSPIRSFSGTWYFLSNFYYLPSVLEFEGDRYPTVEHAYQAAKLENRELRSEIRLSSSPARAKHLGRLVKIRPDWEEIKNDVMLGLLMEKFSHPQMKKALLNTGSRELVEGNNWGDKYWGMVFVERLAGSGQGKWVGENWLGRLLVQVREYYKCQTGTGIGCLVVGR